MREARLRERARGAHALLFLSPSRARSTLPAHTAHLWVCRQGGPLDAELRELGEDLGPGEAAGQCRDRDGQRGAALCVLGDGFERVRLSERVSERVCVHATRAMSPHVGAHAQRGGRGRAGAQAKRDRATAVANARGIGPPPPAQLTLPAARPARPATASATIRPQARMGDDEKERVGPRERQRVLSLYRFPPRSRV